MFFLIHLATRKSPVVQSRVGLDIDTVPRPNLIPEENTIQGINYQTKIEPGIPSVPPSSITRYYSIDEGNSIPRMFRCTLQHLPADAEALFNTAMFPFGVVSQPFAELSEYDSQIPLSTHGGEKLLRCGRCGTYVNPGFVFLNGGGQVKCNMCEGSSPTPMPDMIVGGRSDRPELTLGTYEFLAPQVLQGKKVSGNNFVLLIECTQNAIKFGNCVVRYRTYTPGDSVSESNIRLYTRS